MVVAGSALRRTQMDRGRGGMGIATPKKDARGTTGIIYNQNLHNTGA
jgi:hypothetical protein